MVRPTLNSVTVDYHGEKPVEYGIFIPITPDQNNDNRSLDDRYFFRFTDKDKNGEMGVEERPQTVTLCNENTCSLDIPFTDENVLAAVVKAKKDIKQLINRFNLKQQIEKVATRLAGKNSATSARYIVSVGAECSDSADYSLFRAGHVPAVELYNFDIGDINILTQRFMHIERIGFKAGETWITVLNSSSEADAIHTACKTVVSFNHLVSLPDAELNRFLNDVAYSLQVFWGDN